MELGPISTTLWYVVIAAKVVLAAVLIATYAYRTVPIFVIYAITLAARSLLLWSISHTGTYISYFYAFWTTHALLAALGLAVVWEIYKDTLASFPSVRRRAAPVFGIVLVMLLLLCIAAVISAPANLRSGMVAGLVLLERSVWIVQTGLIVLIVVAARFAGMCFRSPAFGLALGLGLWSAVELLMLAILAAQGESAGGVQVVATQISFLLAVAIWLRFLLAYRRGPVLERDPRDVDTTLLNRALSQLGRE